jgi:hypothetical protein
MKRFFALTCMAGALSAQIILQDSHSKASLRGIHSLGNGVAWASGTGGTVLRTVDGGKSWQRCAAPPGAEKLDFRAVQGFDESTAVVMSAGTGDLSRLYKTTDACGSWKLVLSNPDKEGFWDALQFQGPGLGALVGDPVDGAFPVFLSRDGGNTWRKPDPKGIRADRKDQAIFAASNSSMLLRDGKLLLLTGGGTTSLITADPQFAAPPLYAPVPLAIGESAGGYSLASGGGVIVLVGGDYKAPTRNSGSAAWCNPACHPADAPPGGYRSAVAYDEPAKTWLAVGPTGADISTDNGRTWRPIDLGLNWNAISLPFIAGAEGRIGVVTLSK